MVIIARLPKLKIAKLFCYLKNSILKKGLKRFLTAFSRCFIKFLSKKERLFSQFRVPI